jgi:hypothetical protein
VIQPFDFVLAQQGIEFSEQQCPLFIQSDEKTRGSSIHFRAQKMLSSGVLEGLNNKAKVTMKKSHGFRTFRTLELALYYSPGKLPEAGSTHDFF